MAEQQVFQSHDDLNFRLNLNWKIPKTHHAWMVFWNAWLVKIGASLKAQSILVYHSTHTGGLKTVMDWEKPPLKIPIIILTFLCLSQQKRSSSSKARNVSWWHQSWQEFAKCLALIQAFSQSGIRSQVMNSSAEKNGKFLRKLSLEFLNVQKEEPNSSLGMHFGIVPEARQEREKIPQLPTCWEICEKLLILPTFSK